MRATVLILILALGSGIARAEDLAATTGTGAASGIMVNSSISLNLPLLAADPAAGAFFWGATWHKSPLQKLT